MKRTEKIIPPQEKEDLFLKFFHTYLEFLIHIYKCVLANYNEKDIAKRQLENNLTRSLTLLWQMHGAISTIKMYYKKADYEHGTHLIFDQEQSELVVPQLHELKIIVDHYPFIEKENQKHCLLLLEQIIHHYEYFEFVIVDAELHAAPWLSSSLKPFQKNHKKDVP